MKRIMQTKLDFAEFALLKMDDLTLFVLVVITGMLHVSRFQTFDLTLQNPWLMLH